MYTGLIVHSDRSTRYVFIYLFIYYYYYYYYYYGPPFYTYHKYIVHSTYVLYST